MEHIAQDLKTADVAILHDAQKLKLYALYQQATVGDCCDLEPSHFRPVEHAQWLNWYKLAGLPQNDARRRYLKLVNTIMTKNQAAATAATIQDQTEAQTLRQQRKSARFRQPFQLVAQFLSWMVMSMAILVAVIKVGLTMGRHFITDKTLDEEIQQYEELIRMLSPLLWFMMGYCLVILLRSREVLWPNGLWTFEPQAHSQHRRRYRRQALVNSELDRVFERYGIQVIHSKQPMHEGISTPCLELRLREDLEACEFGKFDTTIPYTIEQTADVYYRKYKEPLPDPAMQFLESIDVLEERLFDEFSATFKRRVLRFRNEAPSLIKRFASADYIEYIEDSLLDKQNRRFYVYVKNESYQSLGLIEEFSVYKAHADKPQWTHLHTSCRVHITSSSLLFFRSKIESFISSYYCKNAPDARKYHLQRIEEELDDPIER